MAEIGDLFLQTLEKEKKSRMRGKNVTRTLAVEQVVLPKIWNSKVGDERG